MTGELAALAVSALWSVGSLLFSWASGRIGALATNVFRITIAAVVLALVLAAFTGSPFPFWASGRQMGLLALSGFVGLVVGDGCYFRSLVLIGPRRATLLAALAPAFTAATGWVFLGERLGVHALAGMAVTLAGTAWVILERSAAWPGAKRATAGTLFGLGAAAGQAVGLVLSKAAMTGLDALATAVIRMTTAALLAWTLAAATGELRRLLPARDRARVAAVVAAGALVGPVCGVWLSLVAIQHTETAVAATLMALTPILVIPLTWAVHRERPTPRAVLGAVIAFAGVAILVSR